MESLAAELFGIDPEHVCWHSKDFDVHQGHRAHHGEHLLSESWFDNFPYQSLVSSPLFWLCNIEILHFLININSVESLQKWYEAPESRHQSKQKLWSAVGCVTVCKRRANCHFYIQGGTVQRRETSVGRCDVSLEATCWHWRDRNIQCLSPELHIEEEWQ